MVSAVVYRWILISLISSLFAAPAIAAQDKSLCQPVRIAQVGSENHANIGSAAWSPDGQYLVTDDLKFSDGAADGQSIGIYTGDTLKSILEIDLGLTSSQGIFWSPQSDRFAYAFNMDKGRAVTGHIDLYAAGTWAKTSLPDFDANTLFQQIVWSPDGKELATVLYWRTHYVPNIQLGEAIRIWDANTNTLRAPVTMALQQAHVVYFNGQWYAAVRPTGEDTLRVIRLSNGAVIFEDKGAYLVDFAADSDGMILAALHRTSTSATLRVWGVETGTKLLETDGRLSRPYQLTAKAGVLLEGTNDRGWLVHSLDLHSPHSFELIPSVFPTVSPDRHYLAVSEEGQGGGDAFTNNGPIQIIDLADGATLATIKANVVAGMAWSPDGQSLAVTGNFGTLSLWSLESCLQ